MSNHAELRRLTAAATEADPRWQSVRSRDASADGRYWYSVETTGVYCRPSCASRLANPANVRFHETTADAERAGFRPCKRCRPDEPSRELQDAERVARACRIIEAAEEPPSLGELAGAIGLSPHHFHRMFKSVTGVTPKAYAAAHRMRAVQDQLVEGASVTSAIYDAGFNSSSRFYEKSAAMLGMAPSAYRAGGAGSTIRFALGASCLGDILVAASDVGICAILLGDDPQELLEDLQDRFPDAELVGADPDFERTVAQVVGFVEAPAIGLDLPLDVRGTAFQQRVWQALREVPAGRTVSYAEVADAIGSPKAVRAVAQACASNPLAVAIPCHRVVKSGGGLSGYRWGVERKRALIDREVALAA